MAKKKAVKKKAVKKKKKKKTTTAIKQVKTIKFKCENGSCKARPKFAHIAKRAGIKLVAVNTNVTINFVHGSPFVPSTNPIHIASGNTVQMTVGTTNGHFDYVLTCPGCKSFAGNPEMIVP